MDKNHFLFLDFGNSRLKSLFNGSFYSFEYSENLRNEVLKYYNLIESEIIVIYSSVNKLKSNKYFELSKFKEQISATELLNNNQLLDFTNISGIGSDRLLGLYFAVSKNLLPAITLDFGTAITINVINSERQVLGGFIMPGFNTSLRALNEFTDALPKGNINNEFKLGENTIDAISIGTSSMIIDGVIQILGKIIVKYFHNNKNSIFITGGNSKIIFDNLLREAKVINLFKNSDFIYEEYLVLKGLQLLNNK